MEQSKPFNVLRDARFPVVCAGRGGEVRSVDFPHLFDPDLRPTAFAWPRADLRLSTSEFALGVLAAAMRPATGLAWRAMWDNPPGPEEIASRLAPIEHAFDLDGDGPRFLQDLDKDLRGEPRPCAQFFIDAASANAVDNNSDLFIKRRTRPGVLSRSAAAMLLYALQTYAPSGGRGFMTSYRGGGPLTTLVLPKPDATIWEIVWANMPLGPPLAPGRHGFVFAWLLATVTSENKAVPDPDRFDPMQAHFGMPRRIRCLFEPGLGRTCMLTGETDDVVMSAWVQAQYGVSYGDWAPPHPLSPYLVPRNEAPRARRARASGIGWGDYLGLVVSREPEGAAPGLRPAETVDTWRRERWRDAVEAAVDAGLVDPDSVRDQARLIAGGYCTDKAKIEAWVEDTLPLPTFETDEARGRFDRRARSLVEAASTAAAYVTRAVWRSLLAPSAEFKADKSLSESVERAFWDATRAPFLAEVDHLARALGRGEPEGADAGDDWAARWLAVLRAAAFSVFDRFAGLDPDRVRPRRGGGGSEGDAPVIAAARQHALLAALFEGRTDGGKALYATLALPIPERRKAA